MENKNSNSNLIVFDNEENVYDNKSSLQDNFKKFLKMRKELRKSQILNKTDECDQENTNNIITPLAGVRSSFRDNPERMKLLRQKFIDQAISYLGVPYGKKYLDESNPLYNSPIFLDCCALIRQCVNDLSEDFGFVLGRWNQSYQFDILPEVIEFSQLERGDLVFYTATFYAEKGWKPQLHDMVHVEIFLGGNDTPERTIAAREKCGVVEYNDTYQFTSENYYDIKYHFRSINTWLRGIHKSFCKEHRWHDELLERSTNKFSLFNCDAEEKEN